jgi:hypothetical protein
MSKTLWEQILKDHAKLMTWPTARRESALLEANSPAEYLDRVATENTKTINGAINKLCESGTASYKIKLNDDGSVFSEIVDIKRKEDEQPN